MTVAIVKYNAGNIFSVTTALERLGASYTVTDDPAQLSSAERVIFPGVGEAGSAMQYLRNRGLDHVLRELTSPVLGICLGFQLLCRSSEEGATGCLEILSASAQRFTAPKKVPHIGWSPLRCAPHPLFEGLPHDPYVYFVHSYFVQITEETIARCTYAEEFAAAAAARNFIGVQFHPEKSGEIGERILKNFLSWKL